MSNQYFIFNYYATRDGVPSASEWRLMYGDVSQSGSKLLFNKAAILSYNDIVRGDAVFSINIAKPIPGDNSRFGFMQFNKNAYLTFNITDGVLSAETSDGVNQSSTVLDWNDEWTDKDIEFRIKWESGMVSFFIDDCLKAAINDDSITGSPMSPYVSSDSSDILALNFIIIKGIQSMVLSQGNADSSFELIARESEKLRITESITTTMSDLAINKFDSFDVSENFGKALLVKVNYGTDMEIEEDWNVKVADLAVVANTELEFTDGIMDPGDIEVVGP